MGRAKRRGDEGSKEQTQSRADLSVACVSDERRIIPLRITTNAQVLIPWEKRNLETECLVANYMSKPRRHRYTYGHCKEIGWFPRKLFLGDIFPRSVSAFLSRITPVRPPFLIMIYVKDDAY